MAGRRWFLAMLSATALTLSPVAPAAPPRTVTAKAQRPPNVIVILADDLGLADVGAYGNRAAIPTPNIDRLARQGVRFDRAYATASVCSPSRAALLSGRYQQRHGFEYLIPEAARSGGNALGLAPEQRVVAETLRRAGYRTAAVGKWHLGDTPDRLPTARGFDSFYGFLAGESAYVGSEVPGLTSVPAPYLGNRSFTRQLEYTKVGRWTAGSPAKQTIDTGRYLTEELTDEAVRTIGAGGRPYFLYLAYNAPHSPFQATRKYLDRFPDERDPLKRVYAAMVSALDDGVGRVLDAVERSGQADNTIVVFSSDNGAATYFGVSDCNELSGGKLSYFEGGARVPFIVRWGARLPAGTVERRNVSQLDVVPTLLAAAGVKPDGPLDGIDLTPKLTGDGSVIHERLFWRTGHEYAVLEGDWKLLSNTRTGSFPWLFDLSDDPRETRLRTFSDRPVVARLKTAYAEWEKGMQPPAWPSKETLQVFQCGRISFQDQ